jgi:DNA repair protein RecN (Recombination protein N)
MLVHIDIHNFVLVDSLSLNFSSGLQVLTGETGAGKSIWVDAIALALGGRADAGVVRHGQSRCDITVGFDLRRIPTAQAWLHEHQMDSEGAECLIRRVIQTEGPSRSTINGVPCPLHLVREFSELVLTIHGQHQQQDLLKSDGQQQQLDQFGKHQLLLQKTQQYYQQWQSLSTKIQTLSAQLSNRQSELELLRYQVSELEQLGLKADEWRTLSESHKQFHHAAQWRQQLQQALTLVMEDDAHAALNQIYRATHLVQAIKIEHPQLLAIARLLNEAAINLQEAGNELRDYSDHLNIDPEKFAEIERRLDLIHQLARKHRTSPESLLQIHQELLAKISTLENAETELNELVIQQADIVKQYAVIAAQLSASRSKAAQLLSTQVTEWMQQLGMQGGRFQIALENMTETIHPLGQERIRFLVSTNPGQNFQPLQKIASGGEISRLHLALQVITAQKEQTPTLIFDEVDVGIGGQTAAIVGKLLRQLGEKTQVLCITHLPQVAAYGHHHFKVSKVIDKKITRSIIEPLDASGRTHELARMLGGENITQQTLSHASEMLQIN